MGLTRCSFTCHLVAGDFNLSTIDEAFVDSVLPTPLGPHTTAGTRFHSGQLGRRLRISQTTWLSTFLEREQNMVHVPSRRNPLVYVPPIKAAITKPGFIWTLLIGATRGPSTTSMSSTFSFKERPAEMHMRESQETCQRNHERPLANGRTWCSLIVILRPFARWDLRFLHHRGTG